MIHLWDIKLSIKFNFIDEMYFNSAFLVCLIDFDIK